MSLAISARWLSSLLPAFVGLAFATQAHAYLLIDDFSVDQVADPRSTVHDATIFTGSRELLGPAVVEDGRLVIDTVVPYGMAIGYPKEGVGGVTYDFTGCAALCPRMDLVVTYRTSAPVEVHVQWTAELQGQKLEFLSDTIVLSPTAELKTATLLRPVDDEAYGTLSQTRDLSFVIGAVAPGARLEIDTLAMGTPAVPEISTAAMALAGLAVIGLLGRLRAQGRGNVRHEGTRPLG